MKEETTMNIKEKIINILTEVTEGKTSEKKITDETNIIDEVGLDSLQMINFILMLEDNFDLEIDFDEIEYEMFLKFNSLVKFINEKIKEQI